MREFIELNNPVVNSPLTYIQEEEQLLDYSPGGSSTQWAINMIITDNEASSVRNALSRLGYDIILTRQTHWEITTTGDKVSILDEIDSSGELYNSNKEFIGEVNSDENTISILVRQKEDIHGRLKHESLTQRFQIKGLEKLRRGVLWNLSIKGGNIHNVINDILETNILFNPLSHECYQINQTL